MKWENRNHSGWTDSSCQEVMPQCKVRRLQGGGWGVLSTWRATVEDRSSCRALARVIWGGNLLQTGLHSPDLSCVLGDGAVTGEFSTAGDVMDHLLGPLLRVLVNRGEGDIKNNTYSVFYSVILDRIKHLKILKKISILSLSTDSQFDFDWAILTQDSALVYNCGRCSPSEDIF